jgi:uncharacterized protein YgiM (DUF1202 family)
MNKKLWMSLATTISTALLAQPLAAQETPAPALEAPAPPALVTNAPAPQPDKPGAKKKPAPKKKPEAKAPVAVAVDAGPIIKPGPAIVREKNLNVRGQPAINSEVVTRLSMGAPVLVLEEVTRKKPGIDEPAKWAKIVLPSSAFVWVHADYVDAATKTVKATKLNLRSGPGENYSILGRIPNGTAIKEVETKGDWIKIEPPADAYAFVAAHLLTPAPAATEIAAVPPPPPTPPVAAPPAETPLPPPTVVMPAEPILPVQPATPEEIKSADTNAAPAAPPTAPPTAPATVPEVKPDAEPAVPVVAPPPTETVPEEPIIKRVVSREGFVRNTVSVQAPSYFKLESLDTKKAINYIFSPTTNIFLRDFYGKRIIVTGEEILDERWPNTPVLNIESIRTVNE